LLAVLFSFNLLSEFQRAVDPALKTYKQPATLRAGLTPSPDEDHTRCMLFIRIWSAG
jgi:hypothetical protein